MGKNINRRRHMKNRKRIIVLGGFVLLCLLLITVIVFFSLRSVVNKEDPNKICKGVYIGDINAAGMTVEDAVKAIEQIEKTYGKTEMTLEVDKKMAKATLAELGFGIKNKKDLADQAVNYCKTGNLWKRYRDIKKLEKGKKVIQPSYDLDKDTALALVQERCIPLTDGALNATISKENDKFVITHEEKGEAVDEKASVKKIETFLNNNWHGKPGTISMVVMVQEPQVTKKQLKTIKDLLGTYTTYYGVGGGRVQNIETSARLMNGNIIMPGQEYSVNAIMEPYTVENGYAEAGSYENGEVVQSMGGGICQVSTTLYNALLFSELKITQRSPHSMLVDYVEPSMDAAIAGDFLDLKFVNNTKHPIFLESILSGGYITFNIYGKETREAGRTLQFVSEIIEKKVPEGKKFEEEPDAAVGTIETASQAYTGIVAKLWKIILSNGVEVGREEVNSSVYEAVKPIVKVGTQSDNAEATAAIKAAIASQNEDNIKAAIASVQTPAPSNSTQTPPASAAPAPATPTPAAPTPTTPTP